MVGGHQQGTNILLLQSEGTCTSGKASTVINYCTKSPDPRPVICHFWNLLSGAAELLDPGLAWSVNTEQENRSSTLEPDFAMWTLPAGNKVLPHDTLPGKKEISESGFCEELEDVTDFSFSKQMQEQPEEATVTAGIAAGITAEILSLDGSCPADGMGHAISKIVTEAVKHRCCTKVFCSLPWYNCSNPTLLALLFHLETKLIESISHPECHLNPCGTSVRAILALLAPTNVREVRGFLGCVGNYRRFIEGYAKQATPLTELLKKEEEFIWTERRQQAFDELKKTLAGPIGQT